MRSHDMAKALLETVRKGADEGRYSPPSPSPGTDSYADLSVLLTVVDINGKLVLTPAEFVAQTEK
ncbi:hypothetical protein ACFQLX_25445 [Streptomyces polyrhachis]|uniref:Uncharacterized protein n=1 Tax=Streptomyces polyrhachis TaxID=1282885 RepID=A0ABW2GL56_9ACTN